MRRFVVTLGAVTAATALLAGASAPSGAVAAGPSSTNGAASGSAAAPPDGPDRHDLPVELLVRPEGRHQDGDAAAA